MIHSCGRYSRPVETPLLVLLACISALLSVCQPGAHAAYDGTIDSVADLADMPPNTWAYVPNSNMDSAEKPANQYADWDGSTSAAYDFVQGNRGFVGITAYSGGAFDTTRNRLMIWGGGHNDYHGNEVVVFDLSTMSWGRLTDPSETAAAPRGGQDPWPDGTPSSRHSYAFIEYDPDGDRLIVGPGGISSSSGGVAGSLWYLPLAELNADPVKARFDWVEVGVPPYRFGADAHSIWDPRLNRLLAKSTTPPKVAWWDGSTTWTDVPGTGGGKRFAPLVYAANRQVALGIGDEGVYSFNLSDSGTYGARTTLETNGPQDVVLENNPGLGYRPADQKVWAWAGGTSMYTLDDTDTWVEVPPNAANRVTPFAIETNSNDFLNGKFRYVPDHDVFIMASDDTASTRGIYFYRPSE